ncbi:MAG TPA: hypothetical protein VFK32_02265 [Tepidiformaceae bacterium]|nr:hypothetical protein [Tepidiformaceae bacterium]
MTSTASTRPATAQAPESAIAARALADVGTWQGDCWPWVRQVVLEATGKSMGFGYRSGFFEGGAVEVTMEEARAGDVIQISDDANSDPGASYPGLHTAIILENLGGGVFNAVDSNQNWDGVVNLRSGYSPFARAATYGLNVHIYRFEGDAGTPDDGTRGAGESPSVPIGSVEARVMTDDGGCLRLRSAGTLNSVELGCLALGSRVWITGTAVEADGYAWVPVTTLAGSGWMAQRYLVPDPAEEPGLAGTPTAEPTASQVPPTATPPAESTPVAPTYRYRVGVAGVAVNGESPE